MDMRSILAVVLATSGTAIAATGNIITFAGGGDGDGGPAPTAKVSAPFDGAFDGAGNFYFTDTDAKLIRRVSASGVITTIAGTGAAGNTGDGGPALAATLQSPTRITVDGAGNVYFVDSTDMRVRKIDTGGTISVVAGNGTAGFSGDGGPATAASLNSPGGIAVDPAGNLYIADKANFRIRKVSGGTITTIAGAGSQDCFVDPNAVPRTLRPAGDGGPASAAFLHPDSLVLDGAGGYYIGDTCGTIRHVDNAGVITRYAGGGTVNPTTTPVDAMTANLSVQVAMTRDPAGNIYVSTFQQILKLTPGGSAVLYAGNGSFGDTGDGGPATSATMSFSFGIAASPGGEVALTQPHRIRKVDAAGIINNFVGTQNFVGDGIAATEAAFFLSPGAIVKDTAGNLFVADNQRVRRIDTSGVITTVAGGGSDLHDGVPATSAAISSVAGLAFDAAGQLLYTDITCVRRVDASGIVTTFAGTCFQPVGSGFAGDGGPAAQATLGTVIALARDAAGNILIADRGSNRVRKVDASGTITTIAGNGLTSGGDGAPATSAGFTPEDIASDATGNLYIADFLQGRVRRVGTDGIITTVAGTVRGSVSSGDGGSAVNAVFKELLGIAVDSDGQLYIADANTIRLVGIDGVISRAAGNGSSTYSGDGGPALAAGIPSVRRMLSDPAGFLYAGDSSPRVRRIEIIDTTPDAFTFTPQSGVAVSTLMQSNVVTLTGFTGAASIAVTGGEYSIGCTGTFVSTAGTINPGQSVCVRHTTSARNNDPVITSLAVGGRTGTFQSTTLLGPGSISLSLPSIDFGGQSMNTTSLTETLTLTNTSGVTVTVNSVTAGAGFGVTNNCATLAPSATCMVNIAFTPAAATAYSAMLTLQNSPGTQTVALTGNGERSLTTHYYQSILRREPDPSGKPFWDGEAARMTSLGANINETWYAMANAFFFSPEYIAFNRSDSEYLVDLYNTFFNRAPDPSGSAFWGAQLAQGVPREVVLVSFMLSPEFTSFTQAIFGNTAARAEVNVVMDFYRGVLSRLPDQNGFNFWVGQLRTAQCAGSPALAASQVNATIDSISSQFLNSTEYAGRNRTNGQYVGDLYNAFLRRGGDPAGVQNWINALNAGTQTREQLRVAFLRSTEFQIRVNAIINQGCLP